MTKLYSTQGLSMKMRERYKLIAQIMQSKDQRVISAYQRMQDTLLLDDCKRTQLSKEERDKILDREFGTSQYEHEHALDFER